MSWLVPACRLLACALPCTWPRKPTLPHWQASPGPLYNTPAAAAAAAPAGPRLPLIPHASLKPRSVGPSGAFGELEFMEWLAKGITVAVKRNGTECVDTAAIDNERSLYEKLKDNPHDHVLPVYGICTDAPDGKVRLVMKYCEKGSLDALLRVHALPEVGASVPQRPCCFLFRVSESPFFWQYHVIHTRCRTDDCEHCVKVSGRYNSFL